MANQRTIEAMELVERIAEEECDGLLGVFCQAYLLAARKALDYQAGVSRDDYFPFGLQSYVQMIWTKATRLRSIAQKGGPTEFESATDSALDIINYAAFMVERHNREKGNVPRP